jgi:endonuclease III
VLENRFREFEGISQKKGSMAVNILVRDYAIPVSGGKEDIDISYDVHVRRVLLRTGLVAKDTEEDALRAARQLSPSYPGALDHPAWMIGQEFCHRSNPECSKCPLEGLCPKKLTTVALL